MRVPALVWAAWRGVRGVERSRRFAALLVALLAASALRHRRKGAVLRTLEGGHGMRTRQHLRDDDAGHGEAAAGDRNRPTTLSDGGSATAMATTTAAAGYGYSSYAGFLVNRAGQWGAEMTRRLAGAIVNSAMEVSRKSRSAAAGAASATQAIWEDTRTLVQKRAADAFASSIEKRLDSMLDVVGEQVKQRMKDEDMPAFVLTAIDDTVDTILPDIKDEFYRRTLEVRDAYLSPALTARRRRAMRANRRSPAARRVVSQLKVGGLTDARVTKLRRIRPVDTDNKLATPARRTLTFGNEADGGVSSSTSENNISAKMPAPLAAPTAQTKKSRTSATAMSPSMHYMWRFERERASCIHNCLCMCCHRLSCVGRRARPFLHSVRAWVLYTLSPYDRSIWWSIKNPRWLALTAVGMVPYIGQLFWLIVFFLKNKRDEYQLIDFITGFQMARFVGQGCGFLLYGCAKYYLCVGRIAMEGAEACITSGPSLSVYGICFFTLQIVIVWVAFFMLPWSKRPELTPDVRQAYSRFGATVCVDMPRLSRKGRRQRSNSGSRIQGGRSDGAGTAYEEGKEQFEGEIGRGVRDRFFGVADSDYSVPIRAFDDVEENRDGDIIYVYDENGVIVQDEQQVAGMWPWASAGTGAVSGADDVNAREPVPRRVSTASRVIIARRGGQLTKMFWYTSTTVVFVTVAIVVALFSDSGWRLGQTLFWIRTAYCLTLFPFIIFKLPMMNPLLTHSHKTGYDPLGRTCLQKTNIGKPLEHRVKSRKRPQRPLTASLLLHRHSGSERKTPKSRVSLKRSMRHRLELRRPTSLSSDS